MIISFHFFIYYFGQVIADIRQLLDLQFDLTNSNGSSEVTSPSNLMKRMSALRQLRDPNTMNRLAQMARQRPPPPPPVGLQVPPGRFNNFRYPPAPLPFMGAPPPPQFQPRPQLPDPDLYYDGINPVSTRNNEREFPVNLILFHKNTGIINRHRHTLIDILLHSIFYIISSTFFDFDINFFHYNL